MAGVGRVDNVKRGVRLMALLAVIAVGGHLVPVAAAPSSSDSKLRTLRVQVEEASAEEATLLGRIDTAEARRRALDGQLGTIDREITRVQAVLDGAQRRFDRVQMQVVAIELRLSDARRALAVAKDDLRRRALAAYMGKSDVGHFAEFVLHSSDMRELAASTGYLNAVLRTQRDVVRRHQQLGEEVARLRDEVETARLEAKDGRDLVAGQRSALEQRRREADGLRRQARAVVAGQARTLQEIQAREGRVRVRDRGVAGCVGQPGGAVA